MVRSQPAWRSKFFHFAMGRGRKISEVADGAEGGGASVLEVAPGLRLLTMSDRSTAAQIQRRSPLRVPTARAEQDGCVLAKELFLFAPTPSWQIETEHACCPSIPVLSLLEDRATSSQVKKRTYVQVKLM